MRRRAESQDVQHESLVVPLPPPLEESALGSPPVRDCRASVLGPRLVSPAIERVDKGADLRLVGGVRAKVRAGRQRTREQDGAVDGRQFALPGALAGLHVEEVIVEAVVAGGVRLGSLPAVPEEAQRGEDPLYRRRARDEGTFDRDRIRRQGETCGGDAGWPVGRG